MAARNPYLRLLRNLGYAGADLPGGISGDDGPGFDVLQYNRAGADDGSFPNAHPRQDGCTDADHREIVDGHAPCKPSAGRKVDPVPKPSLVIHARGSVDDACQSELAFNRDNCMRQDLTTRREVRVCCHKRGGMDRGDRTKARRFEETVNPNARRSVFTSDRY